MMLHWLISQRTLLLVFWSKYNSWSSLPRPYTQTDSTSNTKFEHKHECSYIHQFLNPMSITIFIWFHSVFFQKQTITSCVSKIIKYSIVIAAEPAYFTHSSKKLKMTQHRIPKTSTFAFVSDSCISKQRGRERENSYFLTRVRSPSVEYRSRIFLMYWSLRSRGTLSMFGGK